MVTEEKVDMEVSTEEWAKLGITAADPSPDAVSFTSPDGENIGRLWWEDGKLRFEGDFHESAKLLFELIVKLAPPTLPECWEPGTLSGAPLNNQRL